MIRNAVSPSGGSQPSPGASQVKSKTGPQKESGEKPKKKGNR